MPTPVTAYVPYRCAPRHAKEANGMLADAAAYLDHAEASRCAFAPKTESICRKLGLQNRKAGRGGENERLIHNEAERVFRLVVVVVVTLTLTLTLALALALTLTVFRLCDVSSDGKLDLDELAKMTGRFLV